MMLTRLFLFALTALTSTPAVARGISGPTIGMTEIADTVLLSAAALGMVVPIIAIALLGVAIISSLNIGPIFQVMIAGSLVVLGSALASIVWGAELIP